MTSFLMNEECLLFHGSLLNLIPFFVHLVSAIKKTSCQYQEEIPLYLIPVVQQVDEEDLKFFPQPQSTLIQ